MTVQESLLFENIQTRLCDIDDWIKVADFINRTDRLTIMPLAGEWGLDNYETMKEAIGRMVEKGLIEFILGDDNEEMIRCTYDYRPNSEVSLTYDRVYTKARLAKLEEELDEIRKYIPIHRRT